MTPLEARDEMNDAIETAWDAGASTAGKVLIVAGVRADPPRTGEAWGRITVRHVTGRGVVVGGSRFRRRGLLIVELYANRHDAEVQVNTMAEVILAALEGTRTPGGVFFADARPINVDPENSWSRINVIAEFHYDHQNL